MIRVAAFSFLFLVSLHMAAQQPASQPTNLSFSNVKPYGFILSFTPSQADGYLVVRSLSPISFVPIDGVEYQKGQGIAPGMKVFSMSSTSAISLRETLEGTTYYFAIYAYNGAGEQIDYFNVNPLSGSITTPFSNPNSYYTNLSGNSPTFLNDLKTRLNNGRVFQSYTPGFLNTVTKNIYIRDTVDGKEVINCQYTGETKVFTPPFFWSSSSGEYTREHCLPKSWMFTGGNTDNQDGADYHNLIPANHEKANGKRSNVPYGIVQNVTYQYLEGKLGTNSQGITVYEPRNSIKGDVARSHFYMMVCYNNNGGVWGYQSMPSLAPQQNQDLMKMWHEQDPPDAFERTKHEYIFSLQYNRNPFIDYPELADCINFNNMTLYAGCTIGLQNEENPFVSTTVYVYPNPVAEGEFFQVVISEGKILTSYQLTDIQGRIVLQKNGQETGSVSIPTSGIASGVYTLQCQFQDGSVAIQKCIIQD